MEWYYTEGSKRVGPVSEADFQNLVNSGKIATKTLVWHAGMADWMPYDALSQTPIDAETASPQPGSATGVCRECGRSFALSDMIVYQGTSICAACKPTFFQRLQEGAPLPGVMNYAGFWIRFAAKFVDGIIVGVVNMLLSLLATFLFIDAASKDHVGLGIALQAGLWIVEMTISGAYYIFFLGKYGATPGKMACKLRVVRADGSKLTYGRALGRFFGDMLSGLTLGIGYLLVAFDSEKRALHDRICDTRVIVRQE